MNLKRYSLRFNLDNEDDLRAWERIHREERKSINRAIISAINASYEKTELRELVREAVRDVLGDYQGTLPNPTSANTSPDEQSVETALDFLKSL